MTTDTPMVRCWDCVHAEPTQGDGVIWCQPQKRHVFIRCEDFIPKDEPDMSEEDVASALTALASQTRVDVRCHVDVLRRHLARLADSITHQKAHIKDIEGSLAERNTQLREFTDELARLRASTTPPAREPLDDPSEALTPLGKLNDDLMQVRDRLNMHLAWHRRHTSGAHTGM